MRICSHIYLHVYTQDTTLKTNVGESLEESKCLAYYDIGADATITMTRAGAPAGDGKQWNVSIGLTVAARPRVIIVGNRTRTHTLAAPPMAAGLSTEALTSAAAKLRTSRHTYNLWHSNKQNTTTKRH